MKKAVNEVVSDRIREHPDSLDMEAWVHLLSVVGNNQIHSLPWFLVNIHSIDLLSDWIPK